MPPTLSQKNLTVPQRRFLDIAAGSTVGLGEDEIEFPFSSEEPYDRWGEKEIISHEPGAMNLERLPVMVYLWNHNSEIVLGQVLKVWVKDRQGWCRIRWFDDDSIAKYRKLVESKTVKGVSFQYSVDKWKQISDDSYLVEKFTVFEVSAVSIPADHSVGIRSHSKEGLPLTITEIEERQNQDSPHKPSGVLTESEVRESIHQMGLAFDERLALKFLASDEPKDAKLLKKANDAFMEFVAKRSEGAVGSPVDPLGLSTKEKKKYSLLKAMRSLHSNFADEYTARINNKNSLELEASKALEQKHGIQSQGLLIPYADLQYQRRDTLNTGTPSEGGYLVDTTLSSDFIDLLRNETIFMRLGATVYSGLTGNVNFAKQNLAAAFSWIPESGKFPNTSMGFELIGLRPKKLGGIMGYTQEQLMQSSWSMEMLIRKEMATAMALGLDSAGFWGTGSDNQPLGIFNRPIQSVALGTNGGSLTYANLVAAKTKAKRENINTLGAMQWVTNASVEGTLQTTPKQGSGVEGNFILNESANSLLGCSFNTTEQILDNLAKGSGTNLSALLLGHFPSVMIGTWGFFELLPNALGAGYDQGIIQFRAHQMIDFNVRYDDAFVAITDIITTV